MKAVRDSDRATRSATPYVEHCRSIEFRADRQTQVIVWAVSSDVFVAILVESCHEFFEVFFSAFFTKLLGLRVGVHTGTVQSPLIGLQ